MTRIRRLINSVNILSRQSISPASINPADKSPALKKDFYDAEKINIDHFQMFSCVVKIPRTKQPLEKSRQGEAAISENCVICFSLSALRFLVGDKQKATMQRE